MKKSKIKNQKSKIPPPRPHRLIASSPHRLELGFSMVETLIAIFIVVIGVMGGFAAIVKSLTVAPVVRQDLIGARLAEEGLEFVRSVRDGTLLQIADKIKRGGIPDSACATYATPRCNSVGVNVEYNGDRWEEDFQDTATLRSGGSPASATATRRIALANNSVFTEGIGGTVGGVPVPGMELRFWPSGAVVNSDTFLICQHGYFGLYASTAGGGCPGAPWGPTPYRRMVEVFYSASTSPEVVAARPETNFVVGVSASDCNRLTTTTAVPCKQAKVRVYVWWNGDAVRPWPCPGPQCIVLEDRLFEWTDFMKQFL